MKLSADLRDFEGRIGHRFARPALLVQAVTHGSFGATARGDNQRLEFLGDRALRLVMAQALLAPRAGAAGGQPGRRCKSPVR